MVIRATIGLYSDTLVQIPKQAVHNMTNHHWQGKLIYPSYIFTSLRTIFFKDFYILYLPNRSSTVLYNILVMEECCTRRPEFASVHNYVLFIVKFTVFQENNFSKTLKFHCSLQPPCVMKVLKNISGSSSYATKPLSLILRFLFTVVMTTSIWEKANGGKL